MNLSDILIELESLDGIRRRYKMCAVETNIFLCACKLKVTCIQSPKDEVIIIFSKRDPMA